MGEQKTALILLLILCFAVSTLPLVSASEDSWTTLEPMPTPRCGFGVAVVDGKIYAIGGYNGSNNYLAVNEMYDPATDTWTTKQPMPTPRSGFAVAAYMNKIYVIGGIFAANSPDYSGYTGVNEVYDPSTDTWETMEPMPTARSALDANVVGDKIYLIGGIKYSVIYPDFGQNTGVNEVYDPSTDTWETKAPVLSTNSYCPSAVVDNKIYLFISTQIYDPETDSWSRGEEIPHGFYEAFDSTAGATTGVLAPKRIYVFGGNEGHNVATNHTQVYDPETDTWTTGTPMPTPRWALGVAVVNDELYAIGGMTTGANFSAANEKYTPTDYIPEFPSWIILPLFVTATLAVIICRKKLAKKKVP